MSGEHVAADPGRQALYAVAVCAAAFVLFGFLVASPAEIWHGLSAILISRDVLLTDYFGIGGIGAGCVSAGLVTLASCFVYHVAKAKITGASVAALFLVLGFGLFGKNLLNVWGIVAGVWLYSRFRGQPFATNINVAFFGVALAPIFSEILFSSTLALSVRVPLAIATTLAIGFVLPAAAAQLAKAHMGFSLYNMGFTAGLVGTLVVALFMSYGFVAQPVFVWTTGNNLLLGGFLAALFGAMLAAGLWLDREAFTGLKRVLRTSGQAPSDFLATEGLGVTLVNMALCGAVATLYILCIGGDLNGPVIGAILTIVGFAAYGKHPRNIVPIMLGVFLGSLAKPWGIDAPSIQLAALFGTTLAPIAGRFGWQWGLVAGFIHSSAALTTGPMHAGLNLYNNGLAAGIVASVLVPVIIAIRAVTKPDEKPAGPPEPASAPPQAAASADPTVASGLREPR
jgi:hypothetical protein